MKSRGVISSITPTKARFSRKISTPFQRDSKASFLTGSNRTRAYTFQQRPRFDLAKRTNRSDRLLETQHQRPIHGHSATSRLCSLGNCRVHILRWDEWLAGDPLVQHSNWFC